MISPGMSSCEHSLNTLRYADRVKELAATDPSEIKTSPTDDERGLKIDDQSNHSVLSDSDLAQLRSLNVSTSVLPILKTFIWIINNLFFVKKKKKQEGELSQDLYTFHEAVSALQLMEEEVLDSHKAVMDSTTGFLNDAHKVFCTTHDVDYDQEGKNNFVIYSKHTRFSIVYWVVVLITLLFSTHHVREKLFIYKTHGVFFCALLLKTLFATGWFVQTTNFFLYTTLPRVFWCNPYLQRHTHTHKQVVWQRIFFSFYWHKQ